MNRADDARQSPAADPVSSGPVSFKASDVPTLSYTSIKAGRSSSFRENRRLWVLGGGIVLVMLLLALSGISRGRSAPIQLTRSRIESKSAAKNDDASPSSSIVPILDGGRTPAEAATGNLVDAEQLASTATRPPSKPSALSLRSVPPFEDLRAWTAPPYPGNAQATAEAPPSSSRGGEKPEPERMDKPSLVFVAKAESSMPISAPPSISETGPEVQLPPGTRLRARLEAAANSAVHTPVVAIVEYNYERDREIVIPAGARISGRLDAVDRSGYAQIRFDSLLLPSLPPLKLEGIATDLQLRPLRGHVEGKHTGKNLLVRSMAGVGEVAAAVAGRGSLNQPLSADDMLRERLSNNIGQAADQQLNMLASTQQLVVSFAAGTEIYVVLEKLLLPPEQRTTSRPVEAKQRNVEQLRQLLELQRELDQSAAAPPE
jgi:type IV secretory pathway VirB10-like protein